MSDLLDRPVCGRLSHGVAGVSPLGVDMGRLVRQLLKLSNLQQAKQHNLTLVLSLATMPSESLVQLHMKTSTMKTLKHIGSIIVGFGHNHQYRPIFLENTNKLGKKTGKCNKTKWQLPAEYVSQIHQKSLYIILMCCRNN